MPGFSGIDAERIVNNFSTRKLLKKRLQHQPKDSTRV